LFSTKYNLNFKILSDVDDEVREKFGVPKSLFGIIKGRVTYIIDKKGNVAWIFNSQLNAEGHISKSIEVLKELN
jgi:peroxiredoxin Q/BCP